MRFVITIPTLLDRPKILLSSAFGKGAKRGIWIRFGVGPALALVLVLLPAPGVASLREVREVHYQMGTFLELRVWHSENDVAKRLIREAVGEVHRLEEILSNFDPDSDLSHLNELAGKGKSCLQPDLYRLLKIA